MVQEIYFKKYIALLTFFFLLTTWASAADWAGPDKHICIGKSAQIGSNPVPGACYSWKPETGLNNAHIANPIATPTETTTYTVTVVGPNFSFTASDQVTVFVEAKTDGINAVPLKCCWKAFTPITKDQFTITTTPPGLEGELYNVYVDPFQAPNVYGSVGNVQVNFTAKSHCNEPTDVLSTNCNIVVVNETGEIAVTEGLSGIDVNSLIKGVKYIFGVLEKLPGPCSAKVGPEVISVSGTTADFNLCCPKPDCVKAGKRYSGSLSYAPNVSCNFPFLGIPYVASVNFYVTAGASATLQVDGMKTTCEGQQFCIAVVAAVNAGGGVSGTVLGGSVIKVILALIVTVDAPVLKYCYPSNTWTVMGAPCIKLEAKGSVTLFTFISKSVAVTIIPKTCMN